jgi:glucose/mannose-6-phosphate isomerase
MQPRHTLFAAFTGIYTALKNSGLAQDITPDLVRVAEKLPAITPELEGAGKEIAGQIKGKIPVFVSSDNLGFAAKNMKIQTNENAKHPAFWNTFPELNHNELIGFSELKASGHADRFIAIFLKDPADHPRNRARMDVTADLYKKWGVATAEYTAEGDTLLEKIFGTVTLGLWVTYYLALEYGIDPVPVAGVEDFKARLKETAGDI